MLDSTGSPVIRVHPHRVGMAALALVSLVLMVMAIALSGATKSARADDAPTVRDEDFALAMDVGGQVRYARISLLVHDDGTPGYEERAASARQSLIERFPGAVVVEDDEVTGQFVANSYAWSDHGAAWSYNAAGGPGVSGELGAIRSGADTWATSGADFAFSYSGTSNFDTGACGGGALDGHNTVGWSEQSGSVLAITCAWFSGGGATEFDMQISPAWDWTTRSTGVVIDLQSVATHEFGHALGLGHSQDQVAVMYASYTQGTLKRTLRADDIDGAIAIYGGTARPAPGGTETPAATRTPTPVRSATPSFGAPSAPTVTRTATPAHTPAAGPTATPASSNPPRTGASPQPPSLPLLPGSNLLTWPGQDVAPSLALTGQDGSVTVVYEWDPLTRRWRRFAMDVPPFVNNLTTLRQGGAYWFISTSASSIPITR